MSEDTISRVLEKNPKDMNKDEFKEYVSLSEQLSNIDKNYAEIKYLNLKSKWYLPISVAGFILGLGVLIGKFLLV